VRALLDDLNIHAGDEGLAALSRHPNIEIRAFNPFAHRGKLFDLALDFGRVNHRMHNKVIVTDNAVALVGGRNIADHYFGLGEDSNFRDLDIAAVGPIVPEISRVFDRFWNGESSIPYEAFVDEATAELDTREVVSDLRRRIAEEELPFDLDQETGQMRLERLRDHFTWAEGEVLFDDPAQLESEDDAGVRDELAYELAIAEREFLVESAYFVLQDEGLEIARRLGERGIRFRVLTNSLASNDVVAAHAGYANCRRELLESGAEIYELRPYPGVTLQKTMLSGKSRAGLHTKAFVFDRKVAFIGSYNLDPRSRHLNTEMGLLVRSEEIAEEVAAFMDGGVRPKNSYRVVLESGDLVWLTEEDGVEISYEAEPETGWWTRFKGGLLRHLPITSQL
jgi:putative cardiolipin synthase